MSRREVVIVGGGVSGLATAYYLKCRGIESTLIEKSERLGGLIKTDSVAGCTLEAGPDSYLSTKPAVTELARGLGAPGGEIGRDIISPNEAARRIFISRSGKLIPFPRGMSMMAPGEWFPAMSSELFSWRTKMRFISERFTRPHERPKDISVGELVGDHFGPEVLEYVADPLLVGVYGGDTKSLSAESVLPKFMAYERRFGSLIKGVQQENRTPNSGLFQSFRHGMQTLTDALARGVEGSTAVVRGEATAVCQTDGWQVRVGGELVSAEHLVLACPAHACADLLENSVPEAATLLGQIPYSSAIVATLLYNAEDIHRSLDGFGFLVPRSERQTVAATTWINTKFPSRVAADLVAIRAFIVAEDAVRLSGLPDRELVRLAADDLRRLMGLRAEPQHAIVYRWPNSMPQYVVGHRARLQSLNETVADRRGLHLVGNAYEGVGVPDCVRLARVAASKIADIKTL